MKLIILIKCQITFLYRWNKNLSGKSKKVGTPTLENYIYQYNSLIKITNIKSDSN